MVRNYFWKLKYKANPSPAVTVLGNAPSIFQLWDVFLKRINRECTRTYVRKVKSVNIDQMKLVGNMKLCIYSRKYLNKRIQSFQDVAVPWDPATAFWVSWWDGTRQREENPANAEHRYHDIYMYFVIYDFEFIEVMKRFISCHIQKCTASHARSLSKNWQKF